MPEDVIAREVSLATVWLLGVSMGLTACTATCMPFLGTWALGRGGGAHDAIRHALIFLAGRVLSYACLGTMAAAVGARVATVAGARLGNLAIGLTSILAGVWLLHGHFNGKKKRAFPAQEDSIRFYRHRPDFLPPFFLGASLALIPCAPLAALLTMAVQGGSVWYGAAYGLAFGLGAALTPLLLMAPVCGDLGRRLSQPRPWLRRWLALGAAGVLILLGLRRLGGL